MNRLLATLAMIVMAAFLYILIKHVPRVDLTVIVGLTFLLALYDYWHSVWRGGRR